MFHYFSHDASMFLLPLELVYDSESQGGVVRRIFLLASDQEIFFMECLHFGIVFDQIFMVI